MRHDMIPFFAAATYIPKQGDKSALNKFLAWLHARGLDVAGILQISHIKPGDKSRTIEAVDIRTGHRTEIKRPMRQKKQCGLDAGNLVATSAILRAALKDRPDLVLIEKFGDQEQIGEGLFNEIMILITEGIPLIITVPEPALDIWQERTGHLGEVIPLETQAMQNWWSNRPVASNP